VRFSIKGQGQFKRSLDTDDEREAERRAEAIWYEATYRAKQGLTAKTHTFGSVAESYIAQILREVERGERRADQGKSEPAVIRRYFVSCFGDKPVDAVTEADLERYAEWRRTYWTEGPGKLITHIEYERDGHRLRRPVRRSAPSLSRQHGETVVLRGLLRWASLQGYLKSPPVISIKARRSPDNRRRSFEPHEFARLEAVSLSRLADPVMDGTGAEVRASNKRSWRIKRLDDHTRRDRTVLHAYVMIGAFSGLRPTEMYNLTWGDVLGYRAGRKKSVDDRDIRLQVRGKARAAKPSRRRRRSRGSTPSGCYSTAAWDENHWTPTRCSRASRASASAQWPMDSRSSSRPRVWSGITAASNALRTRCATSTSASNWPTELRSWMWPATAAPHW
jgi:integrase